MTKTEIMMFHQESVLKLRSCFNLKLKNDSKLNLWQNARYKVNELKALLYVDLTDFGQLLNWNLIGILMNFSPQKSETLVYQMPYDSTTTTDTCFL